MPSLEIRRLTGQDAAEYRQVRLASLLDAPDAFGSLHEIEASRPLSEYERRLDTSATFGAFADEKLAGIATFKIESGPKECHKGFVAGMYVERHARRQGIGAALIQALVDNASGAVEQLVLHVVRGNQTALALYERAGFATFGVAPRSLKTAAGYFDEILMVRFLNGGYEAPLRPSPIAGASPVIPANTSAT